MRLTFFLLQQICTRPSLLFLAVDAALRQVLSLLKKKKHHYLETKSFHKKMHHHARDCAEGEKSTCEYATVKYESCPVRRAARIFPRGVQKSKDSPTGGGGHHVGSELVYKWHELVKNGLSW